MRDPMSVYPGLNQVHQGTRTEIEKEVLISAHQIPGRGTGGMHIGPGTENSQTHHLGLSAIG